MAERRKQRIAILGSTGSIGTQTLEVVQAYPDHFTVEMLAAGENWELLAAQAEAFEPDCVVISNEAHYDALQKRLAPLPVKVYAGADAARQAVTNANIDTVVAAMVGFAGLAPTLAAIRAGKKIALANKETLVVAGELMIAEAKRCSAPILPVDSEHSAVFQCLVGEASPARRILLTASGGAFRDTPADRLSEVTPGEALCHPNWTMGPKITIDCATMMNKGFEVIEARWLFGLRPAQIDVVVHPQSVVHSMVEFEDGALKCQMGTPDMKLPIQYALTFPERLAVPDGGRCDLTALGGLTFAEPDRAKYPCLQLAYDVMRIGGGAPCVMNAANEVAVAAFLSRQIRFTDIHRLILGTLERCRTFSPDSLEGYTDLDREARTTAQNLLRTIL